MKHKLLDLFSGIGGFSLGAEANGIPTVAFVEKDPFCQKVLRKHWSNTPIISDIRTVKGEDYETDGVTIVSGGFPCQPFSVAGKRKGTDDDRYLWDETLRVISEVKPKWFIGENVEGLINIQDGMVLRQVQDDLEKEGFQVQCLVIPASSIGAWHQRKRVWIIANSNNNGLERGQSKTCNENASRKDNTSFGGESSSNTSRSDDDGGDKKKSRVDESVSRSHDGDQKKSTTTERLCDLSKKSDECSSVGQTSSDQENNDRTLVQKRQVFQLSNSRGLGDDKASSERDQIRSRDDNTASNRVDTNNVSNTLGKLSDGCSSSTRNSDSKQEWVDSNSQDYKDKVWSETERCDQQTRSRGNISDSNSTGLQGHNTKQELSKQKLGFATHKDDERTRTWWETESKLRGVPHGISYELDENRANRIKALGNSIVPQIAYQLFKSIVTVTKEDDDEQVYWC